MGHEFEEISSRAIAAAIDVPKALGPGFIEPIYQKAMEVALVHRAIPFARQKEFMSYSRASMSASSGWISLSPIKSS